MADQSRHAIITALAALLTAQCTELKEVFDGRKPISAISEDKLPALQIIEGEDETEFAITRQREIHLALGLVLYYKDGEETARNLEDKIIKKIEQAVATQLSGTCNNISVLTSTTPFAWPETGKLKSRGRVVQVDYQQDT